MVLHECLTENGFKQNPADHCVYAKETKQGKVIVIIWVDDLIIAASNEDVMRDGKEMLSERFKMKDLGMLQHFLGIHFSQTDGCVKMSTRYWKGSIWRTASQGKPLVIQNCVRQKML